MSSARKRAYLYKAHQEIDHLKQQLALKEYHYNTMLRLNQEIAQRHATVTMSLSALNDAAVRVSWKYGHSNEGVPSDWSEWVELRNCLLQAAKYF